MNINDNNYDSNKKKSNISINKNEIAIESNKIKILNHNIVPECINNCINWTLRAHINKKSNQKDLDNIDKKKKKIIKKKEESGEEKEEEEIEKSEQEEKKPKLKKSIKDQKKLKVFRICHIKIKKYFINYIKNGSRRR